jgi:uncharacterized protein YndB with AHSA1/START domain
MAERKIKPESTADRELLITRVVDAPRELVWNAWTDPKQVVQWWGPHGFSTTIHKMEFKPGGVWEHTMRGPDGTEYPNRSVFKEIVKPERIVYTHGGGKPGEQGVSFESTWTFEAVKEQGREKTRITMRGVFPTAEERDRVVKQYGALEGGKQTLSRLDDYAASIHHKPFLISRVFKAPRAFLFKLWTEREHFEKWFGPKGFEMKAESFDMRPGGTFHYRMKTPQGQEMWGKAYYRDVVQDRRIVWVSTFSDAQGGLGRHPFAPEWPQKMLTIATFEDHPEGTKVTISWTTIDATEAEQKVFDSSHDSMKGGWGGTFEQLEAYLAKVH